MKLDKLSSVSVGVLKDPTAWFASATSGFSAWWTNLTFNLPTSAAEWAALTLSVVSIVYVVMKIVRLWRNPKREE